jgi:HEAT repeat protein
MERQSPLAAIWPVSCGGLTRCMSWWDSLRLRSTNPRTRSKAVENLAASNDTERLVASLQDESPHVRCAAVRGLAKSRRPDSLKSLVGALSDSSPRVRETAADALGRVGNANATGPLAARLKDPEPSVRRAAAASLRALNWRPSTRDEAARFDIALGNTKDAALAAPKPESSPAESTQQTAFHRRERAEALKAKSDPARISALLKAARGSDSLVRLAAIHDLGQVPVSIVSEELLKFLGHPEPEVRLVASQALAGREDTRPAHLLGLLEDSNPEVRLVAVRFFARVPDQQIVQVLLPLLTDPVAEVRLATATTIGLIGNTSAIEDLVVALVDDDIHVCNAAHQALLRIDPNWLLSDGACTARPRLEALLSSRPLSDLERIGQLLACIGSRGPVAAA